MYQYTNEDVAFERLKDLQREMENSRLTAGSLAGLGALMRNLATRAWWLAGLATRRAPRRRPNLDLRRRRARESRDYEESAASDVA